MERNLGNGVVTWHQATPFHQPRRGCCFLYQITQAPCLLQLAEEWVGEPWPVDSFCELRPSCSQQSLKFVCTWRRGEFKGHQGNEGQQSQRLVADRCLDGSEALSKGKCGNTAEVVIQLSQIQLSLQLPMLNPEFWHSLWAWQGWQCLAQPVCWLKTTRPSLPLSSCHCQGLVRPWSRLSRISWTV